MLRQMPRNRSGHLAYYFPSLTRSQEGIETHMFTEDVHNGVMPYRASRSLGGFSVSFEEAPGVVEFLTSLCRHDHSSHTKEDLLRDVVNEIALRLSWYGRAIYQISSVRDPGVLKPCTPERLYVVPGFYIHHVPMADREGFDSRFIVVSKRNVWDLGMPPALGGPEGYRRILRGLKRYRGTLPLFMQEDLSAQRATPHFKLSDYVLCKEVHEARLTASWGWNRRDLSLNHETEFFSFYRTVTFHWAQAVLRNHIIEELNVLLRRLQIRSMITVQGLPTPDTILEIRGKMVEGKISFDEAYKKTSLF